MSSPVFGCIADDLTGASDISALLTRRGLRVALCIGDPTGRDMPRDVDAIVVALKTRTIAAEEAIAQSIFALHWLHSERGRSGPVYFKYCSTFDSTSRGNIGPVARALALELNEDHVIFCPAFPENLRTVYQGHLFIGQKLIHETGMADHPLTPMRDPDLVRVLTSQSQGTQVGLMDHASVRAGAAYVARKIENDAPFLIADCLHNDDLEVLAQAIAGRVLATGGSAFGAAWASQQLQDKLASPSAFDFPNSDTGVAILAGSCSQATLRQIEAAPEHITRVFLDAAKLADANGEGGDYLSQLIVEARRALTQNNRVLVYSSLPAPALSGLQNSLGADRVGALVEDAMGKLGQAMVEAGCRALIVAGGETSGAVINHLGVKELTIGPEIAPGVPWCYSGHQGGLWLALKSGNFGDNDFFAQAIAMLQEPPL